MESTITGGVGWQGGWNASGGASGCLAELGKKLFHLFLKFFFKILVPIVTETRVLGVQDL